VSQPSGTRARRAAKGDSSMGAIAPPRQAAAAPRPKASPSRRDLDPDRLVALEEERDFLLRSLDDLEREHQAGDVDDDDYQALKDDYTARAADALRAIDARREAVESARPARSTARSWLIAATVIVGAMAAGWLVMAASGDRGPGDTVTGDIRESSIDELARANRYVAEAQAALQAGDSAAAVDAYRSAIDAYDRALDIQPDNVEAMTYRGWLLHNLALQAGGGEAAADLDAASLQWLTQAVDTDPTYPDARIFRAILLDGAGQPEQALADLDAVDPDSLPPAMAGMVESLRARLGTAAAQPGG
jgi:tetratricopeptide (TPR) repeat protein